MWYFTLSILILFASFFSTGLMPVPEARSADYSKGKSIYTELCQGCHGVDGRGAGAIRLNPSPADLTSERVQGKLDAGLFKSIHDGRKNTAMGTWKYALSDAEIHDVIAYVRSLGKGATAPPKP
ncbi:c-type cytochrome [Petrachloros mirabilis]